MPFFGQSLRLYRLFCHRYGHARRVHSFPTRRSSDLERVQQWRHAEHALHRSAARSGTRPVGRSSRSEEHTSELQSQSKLVCRLLLEKKNKSRSHVNTSVTTKSLTALSVRRAEKTFLP